MLKSCALRKAALEFSQAISLVNVRLETKVWERSSVSIIRADVTSTLMMETERNVGL
jgi:hypothetical protein